MRIEINILIVTPTMLVSTCSKTKEVKAPVAEIAVVPETMVYDCRKKFTSTYEGAMIKYSSIYFRPSSLSNPRGSKSYSETAPVSYTVTYYKKIGSDSLIFSSLDQDTFLISDTGVYIKTMYQGYKEVNFSGDSVRILSRKTSGAMGNLMSGLKFIGQRKKVK